MLRQTVNYALNSLIHQLPENSRERLMAARWKKEFSIYDDRQKRREDVIKAVSEGYDTYEEISAQTRIPLTSVFKIVKTLLKLNLLIKTDVKNPRGRTGHRFELKAGFDTLHLDRNGNR